MGARTQFGFSLIEVLTTLSITAVAVTTAVGHWTPLLQSRGVQGAASQLVTDLQFARAEAVSRGDGVRLTLASSVGGSICYAIHTGPASACDCRRPAGSACSDDAVLLKRVHFGEDGLAALVRSNSRSIRFDGTLGTVTPTASITVVGVDGRSLRHVVNIMGRVRTCSPGGAFGGYRPC